MGEGLYCHPDGETAYVELFEDIEPDDWLDARLRYDDFIGDICSLLSPAWWPVESECRERASRIVARNRLHEIWLTEDSYGRVHVTFGVREGLEDLEPLAWRWFDGRASTFFDALQHRYALRVRTGPWTSVPREMGLRRVESRSAANHPARERTQP